MHHTHWITLLAGGAALLVACGTEAPLVVGSPDAGAPETGPPSSLGDPSDAAAVAQDAGCAPPDLLVVLDRSASMAKPIGKGPDGGALPTKMTLATRAITKLTAPPFDATVRFGLEVFPDVAGACASGTILVPPATDQGAAIGKALTGGLELLTGTPLGGPLEVARAHLAKTREASRKQFVLLVTDGGETCASAAALPVVQRLAAEGVQTFVVGFGGAVNEAELDNLACAGGTAPSPATNCKSTPSGLVWVGTGPDLFFSAQDERSLESALTSIAGKECCGCTVR